MNTQRKLFVLACGLLLAATTMSFFWWDMNERGAESASLDPILSARHSRPGTKNATPLNGSLRIDRATRTRLRADLVDLKRRWLAAKGCTDDTQLEELGKESTDKLSCSNELFELLEYLGEIGLQATINDIQGNIPAQFSSEAAPFARAALCELNILPYRRYWSYEAALYCQDSDVEDSIHSLGDPLAQHTVRVARAEVLSRTDPFRALQQALDNLPQRLSNGLEEGAMVDTSYKLAQVAPELWLTGALQRIVKNAPEGTEMAMLERALSAPVGRLSGSPIGMAQQSVFCKWADSDIEAATTYALSNRDRCPPDVMVMVGANAISNATSMSPADWLVGNIPKGAYYDAAADSMLDGWDDVTADEYMRVVGNVSDQELKAQLVKRFERMNEPD